ncbi:hypothetical protein ABKV83_21885 (plasmid) [Enterobacter asburiae]|uniref:hypothetical protein n=1 Tax=Enterobacter asburiae TaxID=61645 RepID=UPI0032AFE1EE
MMFIDKKYGQKGRLVLSELVGLWLKLSKNAQERPRTLDIVYLLGKIVLLPALTSLAVKTANPNSTKRPPYGGFFVLLTHKKAAPKDG